MRVRNPKDLGRTIRDARRSLGWSQSELAAKVGASRQWVSMVENGKTSVDFGIALRCLHSLGYDVLFEPSAHRVREPPARDPETPGRPPARTPLTRRGRRLDDRGHRPA